MNKQLKDKIHRLGLRNNLRDHIVKAIVESPFLFMKETIEAMDLDEVEKYNFYHKNLGRFYFKKQVLKKIKNNKKNGRRSNL